MKGKARPKAASDEEPNSADESAEAAAKPRATTTKPVLNKQSLKAAIWYTVAQIVQEEEVSLDASASEQYVAALTELVYSQAETLALDLREFASHAGRSTIRPEDVRLMARKNSGLSDKLNALSERENGSAAPLSKPGSKLKQTKAAKPGEEDSDDGENAASAPKARPKPRPAAIANAASGSKPPGMPGMKRKR